MLWNFPVCCLLFVALPWYPQYTAEIYWGQFCSEYMVRQRSVFHLLVLGSFVILKTQQNPRPINPIRQILNVVDFLVFHVSLKPQWSLNTHTEQWETVQSLMSLVWCPEIYFIGAVFEAFRAMLVLICIFWNMTPCRQVSDRAVY